MKRVGLIAMAILATVTLTNQVDTQDITSHQLPKHITRRQIYRDDVKYLKGQTRPVQTDYVDSNPEYVDNEPYSPYRPQGYKPTYGDESRPNYKPNYPESYRPSYKPEYTDNDESYKPLYGPNNYEDNFYGHVQKYPEYHKPSYGNDRPYHGQQEGYGSVQPYAPKPKPKPKPSYPKDIVLLQPGPAVKPSNIYADHYDGYRPSSVPGTPGKDYPNYTAVPSTTFDCLRIKNPSYEYMYPDAETGCQVFHQCHADGRQDSFLCPLGTIFDGETQTCDWWFNARCY